MENVYIIRVADDAIILSTSRQLVRNHLIAVKKTCRYLTGEGALSTISRWRVGFVPHARPSHRGSSVQQRNRVCEVVYAVVRAGGRQEKVEVGTIVTSNRSTADTAGNIQLPAVLVVDGDTVTSDAKSLAKVKVTAEILGDLRGPKIVIQKFKNKTGYKKRQGHRQELTRMKITEITK